jgi:hypothetical protein
MDNEAYLMSQRIKNNLSACAEYHGLCLWLNAQDVPGYLTHQSAGASADFAVGG